MPEKTYNPQPDKILMFALATHAQELVLAMDWVWTQLEIEFVIHENATRRAS